MLGQDSDVTLTCDFEKPEFDAWRWHDYWIPLDTVIEFKRAVYKSALDELSRLIFSEDELLRAQWAAAESISQAMDHAMQAGMDMATALMGGLPGTTPGTSPDEASKGGDPAK
jgi:putative (di)nucleoside polyphosphate hydrolase